MMEGYEKRLKRGTKTRIIKRDGNKCVLCDTWHNLVVHHFWDGLCDVSFGHRDGSRVLPLKEHDTPYWNRTPLRIASDLM